MPRKQTNMSPQAFPSHNQEMNLRIPGSIATVAIRTLAPFASQADNIFVMSVPLRQNAHALVNGLYIPDSIMIFETHAWY